MATIKLSKKQLISLLKIFERRDRDSIYQKFLYESLWHKKLQKLLREAYIESGRETLPARAIYLPDLTMEKLRELYAHEYKHEIGSRSADTPQLFQMYYEDLLKRLKDDDKKDLESFVRYVNRRYRKDIYGAPDAQDKSALSSSEPSKKLNILEYKIVEDVKITPDMVEYLPLAYFFSDQEMESGHMAKIVARPLDPESKLPLDDIDTWIIRDHAIRFAGLVIPATFREVSKRWFYFLNSKMAKNWVELLDEELFDSYKSGSINVMDI